ncbi:MAG: beta-propeller domain-containing protein [Ruminococcus sp.]|nr:beta-propeller domain-containing protein [Ruminococcus sp.]
MNNNDEKIKKALENEEVPKELEPENIKKMLDEKAPSAKRKNISIAGKITAIAAACAVIAGSTAAYKSVNPKTTNCDTLVETSRNSVQGDDSTPEESSSDESTSETQQLVKSTSYMTGAEDYEQIYTMIKEASKNTKTQSGRGLFTNGVKTAAAETAMADTDNGAMINGFEETNDEVYDEAPAVAPEQQFEYGADESSMAIAEVPEYEPETVPAGEFFRTDEESSEIDNLEYEPDTVPDGADEESSQADDMESDEITEESNPEHSETYNQEENVLEADIVKTDGKNIYYVNNSYYKDNKSELHFAAVDNGMFTSSGSINISDDVSDCFDDSYETDVYIEDMYLYNDMIAVLGTVNGYDISSDYYASKSYCFVTFYTTGENPELIDTYYQDGGYNDVRISPDGYMYLITNYHSYDYSFIDNPEQIEKYIPSCGLSENIECIPAGDVLLPDDAFEDMYSLSYSVIGSIDLTQSGTFSPVETKALAGYAGEIYCSGNNLYTAYGWDNTDITRISVNSGIINPEASATVDGRVKDQFSMSEYGGYFRIAVTYDEYEEVYHSYYDDETAWDRLKDKLTGEESGYYSYERIKRDNRLYILDMDLNVVGSIGDFGIDEEIKSVKFSGNTAYVVTYEQTDPLFAFDLSDPTNPVMLDEFKILGYSTYMQDWDDGMLLGFGVNADENGIETGIKLTMFDNSDPYNLDALATYTLDRTDEEWLYSEAVWERKALLIAPEKNLIGVPVTIEKYHYYNIDEETEFNNVAKYMFFEYTDGEFVLRGEISSTENNAWIDGFSRAIYIGDYVYALAGDKFISADIETITECDRVDF